MRVDFHLHSPGISTFNLPPNADIDTPAGRSAVVQQYVDQLEKCGIELGAITDYQGVREDWYAAIRDAADARGITLLPGAELAVSVGAGRGVHILLICGTGTSPNQINECIRRIHARPEPLFDGRKQHHDVELNGTLSDALSQLRRHLGCAVVAAHVCQKDGIVERLSAEEISHLVTQGIVDALDHPAKARDRLRSHGQLTSEQLDTLAMIESSDNKSIDEIGTKTLSDGSPRATWLKLSDVSADAIRLALHDPQTRVLRREPEPVRHERILEMRVDGSGFLGGMRLRFNDDMTTLIGGRGAGKSAVLETLRYALDGQAYSEQPDRESLVQNALKSGGKVTLVVERPGQAAGSRYEISRVWGQQSRVKDLDSGENVDVSPMSVLGARTPAILLQREVQAVARTQDFRLDLLDQLIGERVGDTVQEVKRVERTIKAKDRDLAASEERLERRQEYLDRRRVLDAEIEYFEKQGVADKLRRHSALGADQVVISRAQTSLDETGSDWVDAADASAATVRQAAQRLRGSSSHVAERMVAAGDALVEVTTRLEDLTRRWRNELDRAEQVLRDAASDLSSVRAGLDDELNRVKQELGTDTVDPDRLLQASGERTAVTGALEELAETDRRANDLARQRDDLLAHLQKSRHAVHTLRQESCRDVTARLGGRLRVTVEYLGDTSRYRSTLTSRLKGSSVTADAIDTLVSRDATDGVELAKAVRKGASEVRRVFTGISANSASRLVAWLADPSRLRAIEVLAPEDRVDMELKVAGDEWRDLSRLSSGQRATAVLLLLFAQPGRLLVLDQPEDDLDNRFVYEDVVGLLRDEKGVGDPARRRQVILATHNANIPVNGDAEQVVSLEDDGGHAVVRTRASIDNRDVRETIRTVLEGGKEAFRRRAEKYGGLDDA